MPSTGIPTPFSGLNQWELADKPRMEDFNADNQIIDAKLADLAEHKASQAELEQFQADSTAAIDGKADMANAIYPASAAYVDGFFDLDGLPEELPEVFTVRFAAPERFTPGDELRIDTTELEIVTPSLSDPDFGAFATGALVSMDVDRVSGRAYLATAASGTAGSGKRFDAFDLPPSRIASIPAEWEFESFAGDIGDVRGVQTVGDESYLFASNAIYVYNHLTGENTKYTHTVNTSADMSCAAYTLERFVCFEGGYEKDTYSVAINVDTKRIQQIATTNRPTCVVPGKNGSVYAFGGLEVNTGDFVYSTSASTARPIYTAKRGSDINSAWDITSVASFNAQVKGSTTYYFTGPKSAAGYADGEKIWFAVSTPASSTNHPTDYARYVYDIGKNTLQRTAGKPAFCAEGSTAIPYGFEYEGRYYGVHGRKISVYDFASDSIDASVAIPDAPVDRPNLITVYKNTWVVFTAQGIYRLVFTSEDVPADIGGVLEIYAGQRYRAEKTIAVKNKITITPQWQLATEDIEIKLGEYHSPGSCRVYVKTV